MPVSVLDENVALLAVDFQIATTGRPAAHDIDGVIAAGVRLIAAFRTAQLPVVVTRADLNAPPAGRTVHSRPRPPIPESALAIVPAIGPQPGDVVIGRRAWSPFAGTDLDARLRSLGVTQVVFSGLATSFGIESGVRAAYDLGYHVVVATDAITDPFVERHDYAVSSVFPILAELGTSEEIACLLAARR